MPLRRSGTARAAAGNRERRLFVSTSFLHALIVATGLSGPALAQCDSWEPSFGLNGADNVVYAMAVFEDGSGPALYVGGAFTAVGDTPASRIVKYDGATWTPLGTGVNDNVLALAVHDDGSGPALFAGGSFDMAGGAGANH